MPKITLSELISFSRRVERDEEYCTTPFSEDDFSMNHPYSREHIEVRRIYRPQL